MHEWIWAGMLSGAIPDIVVVHVETTSGLKAGPTFQEKVIISQSWDAYASKT